MEIPEKIKNNVIFIFWQMWTPICLIISSLAVASGGENCQIVTLDSFSWYKYSHCGGFQTICMMPLNEEFGRVVQ